MTTYLLAFHFAVPGVAWQIVLNTTVPADSPSAAWSQLPAALTAFLSQQPQANGITADRLVSVDLFPIS